MRRDSLDSRPQFGPLLLRFPVSYAFSCRVRMRSPVHGGRSFTWASCPVSELPARHSCHAHGVEFGHSAASAWLGTAFIGRRGEQSGRSCRGLPMRPIVPRGGSATGNHRSMSRLWIGNSNSSSGRRVARTDSIGPAGSGDGSNTGPRDWRRSGDIGHRWIPKANHASAAAVKVIIGQRSRPSCSHRRSGFGAVALGRRRSGRTANVRERGNVGRRRKCAREYIE